MLVLSNVNILLFLVQTVIWPDEQYSKTASTLVQLDNLTGSIDRIRQKNILCQVMQVYWQICVTNTTVFWFCSTSWTLCRCSCVFLAQNLRGPPVPSQWWIPVGVAMFGHTGNMLQAVLTSSINCPKLTRWTHDVVNDVDSTSPKRRGHCVNVPVFFRHRPHVDLQFSVTCWCS